MIHPLLHLIATKPYLIAEHAAAYADLVGEEVGDVLARWKLRIVLLAIALFLAAIGIALAGVALMLWAVTPPSDLNAPWALIAAPLVPLLAAWACFARAGAYADVSSFDGVRQQMRDDLAMLRQVGTP